MHRDIDIVFRHGGCAGRQLASIDWQNNPLGPVADWSPSLRISAQTMLASYFPKALVWGPEMITLHNDAFLPILGRKPSAQGRSFADVWAEAWPEIGPIARKAMSGTATFIENFPLRIERNGFTENCHFTFCYGPARNEAGEVEGFIDTVMETSETVRAQNELKLMNAELSHRIRNTYAMVTAIARQTLCTAEEPDEAWEKLSQRFHALADAQHVLTPGAARRASLRRTIRNSLDPHLGSSDMPEMTGPDVQLSEREVLAVSLAMNELATNALKHGALASGGTISIAWTLDDGQFELRWTETGVTAPPVEPRMGFGRQLLETIIPQDLQGEASIRHDPGRLVYTLTARLTA